MGFSRTYFAGIGAIKSVQHVPIAIGAGVSAANVTITAVDTTKTALQVAADPDDDEGRAFGIANLTSPTNLQLEKRNTSVASVHHGVQVIEYEASRIKSFNSYEVSANLTPGVAVTASIAITPVDTSKTILHDAGAYGNQTGISLGWAWSLVATDALRVVMFAAGNATAFKSKVYVAEEN